MAKILIFAGTTEGRTLAEALKEHHQLIVCTATDYGKQLLPNGETIRVLAKRLTKEEMVTLITDEKIEAVVDGTHPYATIVSENIRYACVKTNCSYTRLLREEEAVEQNYHMVKDSQEAVEFLNNTQGNILLTTGSKDLHIFTRIDNYKERLYPRILPMVDMVEKAANLGIDPGHLICMQGPFTYELNKGMISQIEAKWVVTKESGEIGGFSDKVKAAKDRNAKLLVIGRPNKESGVSLETLLLRWGKPGTKSLSEEKSSWFPSFINISGRKVVVIGAGKIAKRRINTLIDFDCKLNVIGKELEPEVEELQRRGVLTAHTRGFVDADLDGADIVLAATDDRLLNEYIGKKCKEKTIMVNVADRKEECDFYFPGVVRKGNLVIGLTAQGKDHGLVKWAKTKINSLIDEDE
ncbi:MAG: precorrin-6A reductase [Anaerovoracaceae bacterium]